MSKNPGRRSKHNVPQPRPVTVLARTERYAITQCEECGEVHIHQFVPFVNEAGAENEERPQRETAAVQAPRSYTTKETSGGNHNGR